VDEAGTAFDAERPPTAATAADALAIIEGQQARTAAQLRPNSVLLYALWGTVWLVIGVLYFAVAAAGLAEAAAGWSTTGLVIAGMVISLVAGVRSSRGVRGASTVQGALWGLGWTIAMIGVGVLLGGVARLGASGPLLAVLSPAVFVFVVGVLYLVTGAVWTSRTEYVLGVWTIVVALASVYVALPGSPLVIGLGGGGGLLAAALVHSGQARARRPR